MFLGLGQVEVEKGDSLHSKTSWCLAAKGHLESKLFQLHYAKRHSAQSDLFWRLHFLLLYATDLFLCILGGIDLTRLDTQPSQTCPEGYIFLLLYATVARSGFLREISRIFFLPIRRDFRDGDLAVPIWLQLENPVATWSYVKRNF